jgi:hypothetical protein
LHLAYGVWFHTKSPTDVPKTSVKLVGEAFLASYPGWGGHEMDDASQNRIATEILRTGVPRTRSGALCLHNPIYNYFLAACYRLGGIRLLSVAVPQAALSGAIAVLVAFTALRLTPQGGAAALLAGGCPILINESLAGATAYIAPVHLLLFLQCVALYVVAGARLKGPGLFFFVLAFGAAVYTQAAFFVVGTAGAVWLLLGYIRFRKPSYLVAGLVLSLLVMSKLALSVVRLDGVRDDTVREADRGTLWVCNNPYYENLRPWERWSIRFSPEPRWNISPEQLRRHEEYLARAGGDVSKAGWLYLRENPVQYAKLCFIRMWSGIVAPDGRRWQRQLISFANWWLIFPVGLYSLWKNRRWEFSKLAGLIILAEFALLTFILPNARYRLPAEMLLTIYAAIAYADWWRAWWQGRRFQQRVPDSVREYAG